MTAIVTAMAYISFDMYLTQQREDSDTIETTMRYLMIVSMFTKWIYLTKYLRFNPKFSNLIVMVT